MLTFLSMGSVLGLSAGISPGPLLTLVITETLKHNKKEGIKIALTPLITDCPVIILSLILQSYLARSQELICAVSFIGGGFVLFLGYESLKTRRLMNEAQNPRINSVGKGVMLNILNPHPYLFWITVGAPVAMKAWHTGKGMVVLFFLSFYFFLVGSKITVALLVDRSKSLLNSRAYVWIMRSLGVILVVFAILFFMEGIQILKGI